MIHKYEEEGRSQNLRCVQRICARTPLFNIYVNDLLVINGDTEGCNFADDTTYYGYDTSVAEVIRKLETNVYNSAIWFDNNSMKLNAEKFHLILGKNREKLSKYRR